MENEILKFEDKYGIDYNTIITNFVECNYYEDFFERMLENLEATTGRSNEELLEDYEIQGAITTLADSIYKDRDFVKIPICLKYDDRNDEKNAEIFKNIDKNELLQNIFNGNITIDKDFFENLYFVDELKKREESSFDTVFYSKDVEIGSYIVNENAILKLKNPINIKAYNLDIVDKEDIPNIIINGIEENKVGKEAKKEYENFNYKFTDQQLEMFEFLVDNFKNFSNNSKIKTEVYESKNVPEIKLTICDAENYYSFSDVPKAKLEYTIEITEENKSTIFQEIYDTLIKATTDSMDYRVTSDMKKRITAFSEAIKKDFPEAKKEFLVNGEKTNEENFFKVQEKKQVNKKTKSDTFSK